MATFFSELAARHPVLTWIFKGTTVLGLSGSIIVMCQTTQEEIKNNVLGWKIYQYPRTPNQVVNRWQGMSDPYFPREPDGFAPRMTEPEKWQKKIWVQPYKAKEEERLKRQEKELIELGVIDPKKKYNPCNYRPNSYGYYKNFMNYTDYDNNYNAYYRQLRGQPVEYDPVTHKVKW